MTENKHFLQQITLDDLKAEVVRELNIRRKVYPNWIEQGRISKATADYRILLFERLAIELEILIKKECPQFTFFERSTDETF